MQNLSRIEPELAYLKTLVGSGFAGITSARRELGGHVFAPPLKSVVWTPMAFGAFLGACGSRVKGDRRPSHTAMGACVGGLVGFGAALVWASRQFTGRATRKALQLIADTRDAHWLKANPIDYA